MNLRSRKLLTLIAALGVIAAACGNDSDAAVADDPDVETDDEAAAPADDGDAAADGDVCTADRIGGEVTMGTFSPPPGLDPLLVPGSGVAGGIEAAAVFDRLAQWDPETGEHSPRLAESIEPNEDFTEWTVTLPEDVLFGNGDPLTADAVKFSVERMQGEDNVTANRGQALTIQSVEVVDDHTVVFDVGSPWPGFPAVLADETGMIINPNVLEQLGEEEFGTLPVGAGVGPYEPERFAAGEEIVLRAKDDYWGGPVCIERITFVTIPGASATYDAFLAGNLDVAFLRQPSVIEQARADGAEITALAQNAGEMFLLNQLEGHDVQTQDVRVRQAINLAIDRQQVMDRAEDGAGIPTSAIIGEGSLFFQSDTGVEHDPEAAAALVEEVKEETGWDGSLGMVCDTAREDMALSVAAQLDAVGFDVQLNSSFTIGDLISQVRVDQDFETSCWGLNVDDGNLWLRLQQNLGSGGVNPHGYESDEMDAALAELRAAVELDEQLAALDAIQEIWNEEVPSVGIATVEEAIVSGDHVEGLDFTSKAVVLFDQAYIE